MARIMTLLAVAIALSSSFSFFVAATPKPAAILKRQLDDSKTYPSTVLNDTATPCFTTDELFSMTQSFLDTFVYPADIVQVNAINSTVFSENVIGRVDVTRDFKGRQLNTEYIYGLFTSIANNPNPDFFTLLGYPTSVQLSHWTGLGNVVSFAIVANIKTPAINLDVPVEIDVWLTFDANKQISQYDATFRYLQWAFDTLATVGMQQSGVSDKAVFQKLMAQKLATSICSVAANSCNGTNQQYASTDECMTYLTSEVRFGQAYEMGMNTLLCRMIHQGMVPLAPDVHCSHIGPTGGAYCVDDRTYQDTITEVLFTDGGFVAQGLPGAGWLKEKL